MATYVSFTAGAGGEWRIERLNAVRGESLAPAPRLARVEHDGEHAAPANGGAAWTLRGVRSYDRYTTAAEKAQLASLSPDLGRASASVGVLIPLTKSPAWWALGADERRAILEDRSRHIATGAAYLPAIARRLYHGRDLGEPWDFLTWFELADADRDAFAELVARLRASEEWQYVTREVEIWVAR